MKLQQANIKEGEWDWFFQWQRAILIGSLVAGFFLLMIILTLIINKN